MTSSAPLTLRLGTRGSLLARVQSGMVAERLLKLHPGLRIETTVIKTSGDQIADRPLHDEGGKGLFVRELERALLDRQIDFAVHSFKDVPVTMPLVEQEDLIVAAIPAREDPRDAIISAKAARVAELPARAKVGTGSLRRRAQLLSLRPDLDVLPIRGNIDTRLRKLRDGVYDAVILAMAGLRRSGLFDSALMRALEIDELLPAAGQGALSIQCRKKDLRTRQLLLPLDDPPTALCVQLERDIVRRLEGDCYSPIAALARIDGDEVDLRIAVGRKGGQPPLLKAQSRASVTNATPAVDAAIGTLLGADVRKHLHG